MTALHFGPLCILMSCWVTLCQAAPRPEGNLPLPGTNKVAYYVFDSGGPDHFPLTTFTDAANIVVLFEGKLGWLERWRCR